MTKNLKYPSLTLRMTINKSQNVNGKADAEIRLGFSFIFKYSSLKPRLLPTSDIYRN